MSISMYLSLDQLKLAKICLPWKRGSIFKLVCLQQLLSDLSQWISIQNLKILTQQNKRRLLDDLSNGNTFFGSPGIFPKNIYQGLRDGDTHSGFWGRSRTDSLWSENNFSKTENITIISQLCCGNMQIISSKCWELQLKTVALTWQHKFQDKVYRNMFMSGD